MVDSVADLAKGLSKAATAIGTSQTAAVSSGALKAKRAIEGTRDKATGGDGRLSGVGRRGAKLGVRYDVKDGAKPTAVVKATGPWQLIERDTKSAGVIRPKGRRRRGSGGAKALAAGGFGLDASIGEDEVTEGE